MNIPDDVHPGLVLGYSYLWADEQKEGREEGIKDRPAVVVLSKNMKDGVLYVTVAAITHSPPRGKQGSIAIDPRIKDRLGLDDDVSYVVTDELNTFVWPGPDLRPTTVDRGKPDASCVYGYIPQSLLTKIGSSIAEHRNQQRFRLVKRSG
ncbi:type II toxin-antitoxin system PemK/MazF family toxin [Jiella avicenniae]|uniref:Type II toxin-antitoxin system PemK/MazF family toxin n=1 Tax=Jiella avicenniae TaxID=2907202 RepID=A0A9X1T5V6_9HYPH|nr:type II toxin-antitoxin system PemK/MazF family toxin [Jiella avicenniae]MCE7028630.1 type II toxin-antitoxin system PemK/MazF family toxin [Jiella avicenniae]